MSLTILGLNAEIEVVNLRKCQVSFPKATFSIKFPHWCHISLTSDYQYVFYQEDEV
jgi:hypothetical protein